MEKKYYIQKGSDPAKDIWVDYGVIVVKTEGMNSIPPIKKPFVRNWSENQGDDTYIPSKPKFESKKITLTFRISKNTVSDVRSTIKAFLKYTIGDGNICYFDTLKKNGFRGYYQENKLNSESYRETGSYIDFDLEFIASNGICEGFDNSSYSSIFVDINEGESDFYFSDGVYVLGATEGFIKDQIGGFVIYCPSVYGGVLIEERVSKPIGIGTKIIGIGSKIIGI